jgi:hypothetical protein
VISHSSATFFVPPRALISRFEFMLTIIYCSGADSNIFHHAQISLASPVLLLYSLVIAAQNTERRCFNNQGTPAARRTAGRPICTDGEIDAARGTPSPA